MDGRHAFSNKPTFIQYHLEQEINYSLFFISIANASFALIHSR
jgi:hypothetical protein